MGTAAEPVDDEMKTFMRNVGDPWDGGQDRVVEGSGRNESNVHVPALTSGELRRSAGGHDLPAIDEDDTVAQPLDFIHEMRHEDHRDSTRPYLLDETPCLTTSLGVEPGGEFIEDR